MTGRAAPMAAAAHRDPGPRPRVPTHAVVLHHLAHAGPARDHPVHRRRQGHRPGRPPQPGRPRRPLPAGAGQGSHQTHPGRSPGAQLRQPAGRPGHHLPQHHPPRRPRPARLPARHPPTGATASSPPATPFSLSGLPAQSRGPSVATTRVTSGSTYRGAALSAASLTGGANVDVIGNNDVTQQATINGVNVFTCNPGKDTAQNETTIASSGSTLVAGTNDYRLYEPSENRYDSSGGFYRSTDGGTTWSAGVLPGLVPADNAAPRPDESAGVPAVVAGAERAGSAVHKPLRPPPL